MIRWTVGSASAVLVLGLLAAPASAQLASNPVYPSFVGSGVSLKADLGGGVNEESGKANYIGGRLVVDVSIVSVWSAVGYIDGRVSDLAVDDKEIAVGGGAALNFIGTAASPVAFGLNVGGGTVGCGTECRFLDIVAGPALKLNSPTTGFGIEPWVMPRVHVSRMAFRGTSVTQMGLGGSVGVIVELAARLGFHAALDFASFPTKVTQALTVPETAPVHVGCGLHYRLGG